MFPVELINRAFTDEIQEHLVMTPQWTNGFSADAWGAPFEKSAMEIGD